MRLLIVGGMLTLAVSASVTPANATLLDIPYPGKGMTWAGYGKCSSECRRQLQYTVSLPCSPGMPGYVSGRKGLCDRLVVPVETALACVKTCLKAKDPQRAQALGWGR
jgi:hypothetical protein